MRLIDERGRLFGRINLIDGAVLFFLLFSAGLFLHFSYHNLMQHTTLTLEDATPKLFVPKGGRYLSIRGNGFKENIEVRVDGTAPLCATWVNEARIDLQLDGSLEPGPHQISLRNPGGRLVSRNDLFQIRWEPEVNTISMQSREGTQSTYRITGSYLYRRCSVWVDGKKQNEVKYINSQEIHIIMLTPREETPAIWKELIIRNEDGGEGEVRVAGDELREKIALWSLPIEPKIARIIPDTMLAWQKTGIIIAGNDLRQGCEVLIGGQPLQGMQWYPPNLITGFLPPGSLPAGKHEIEAINSSGARKIADMKLKVVDRGMVEMELRLLDVDRKDLESYLAGKKNRSIMGSSSPLFQVTQILEKKPKWWVSRKKLSKEVRVRGRLEVELRPEESGEPLYFYHNDRLKPGQQIAVPISVNRAVQAIVERVPAQPTPLPDAVKKKS